MSDIEQRGVYMDIVCPHLCGSRAHDVIEDIFSNFLQSRFSPVGGKAPKLYSYEPVLYDGGVGMYVARGLVEPELSA